MADEEGELFANPLVTASDQELIDELIKRFNVSDQHGMIMITGRPREGDPTNSDGKLTVSGTNPKLIQFLMGLLVKNFKLRGCPDGRIEIPPLALTEEGALHPQDMGNVLPSTPAQLRVALAGVPGVIEVVSVIPGYYQFVSFTAPAALNNLLGSWGLSRFETMSPPIDLPEAGWMTDSTNQLRVALQYIANTPDVGVRISVRA